MVNERLMSFSEVGIFIENVKDVSPVRETDESSTVEGEIPVETLKDSKTGDSILLLEEVIKELGVTYFGVSTTYTVWIVESELLAVKISINVDMVVVKETLPSVNVVRDV